MLACLLTPATCLLPACRDRKAVALLQRQDRLLHCCLALLLNLAEDAATERKMKNKVGGGWAGGMGCGMRGDGLRDLAGMMG